MNHEITFKLAEPQEATFIFQSLKEAAAEANLSDRFFLTKENLWKALFSEKAFAESLLAYLDNQPVGLVLFSVTNRNFDLFNGPGIYMHCLYVAKSFRRKKVATQLTQEIKKLAQERQCCRVDWVVLKQNQSAIDFYNSIQQAKEVDYIHYMRMEL